MQAGAKKVHETTVRTLGDWIALALIGIGVSFPAQYYLGGLFMALAGAAVARNLQPETTRGEFWLSMLAAFLASTMGAELGAIYLLQWPPQLIMAICGFASRFIARAGLAFLGQLETRTDTLFDRVLNKVLPPRNGGQP